MKSDMKLFELTSQRKEDLEKAVTAHKREIIWIVNIFVSA